MQVELFVEAVGGDCSRSHRDLTDGGSMMDTYAAPKIFRHQTARRFRGVEPSPSVRGSRRWNENGRWSNTHIGSTMCKDSNHPIQTAPKFGTRASAFLRTICTWTSAIEGTSRSGSSQISHLHSLDFLDGSCCRAHSQDFDNVLLKGAAESSEASWRLWPNSLKSQRPRRTWANSRKKRARKPRYDARRRSL